MDNEIAKELREAFLEILREMGTECQAGGEKRRALLQDNRAERTTTFKFADEFPLKKGDKIKNWATEVDHTVMDMRPVSKAGGFHHFEVTTS
jgi:hypothetical protein